MKEPISRENLLDVMIAISDSINSGDTRAIDIHIDRLQQTLDAEKSARAAMSMAEINTIRSATGVGRMRAKAILIQYKGNIDAAIDYLRRHP